MKTLKLGEITLFALLGTLMLVSKLAMEFLPNFHLLGMLTVTYTVVFKAKALIPIYVYVFLNGLISGFSIWWIPYLYIWAVLWGAVMLMPKFNSKWLSAASYITVCALHGFLFGVLYAPAQALLFGLDFKQTVAWVVAGLPFDLVHGIGNILAGTLILPLSAVLKKTIKTLL